MKPAWMRQAEESFAQSGAWGFWSSCWLGGEGVGQGAAQEPAGEGMSVCTQIVAETGSDIERRADRGGQQLSGKRNAPDRPWAGELAAHRQRGGGYHVVTVASAVESCKRGGICVKEYLELLLPGLNRELAREVGSLTSHAWLKLHRIAE